MTVANLKCPHCGKVEKIEIPTDKCLQSHKCKSCGKLITAPKDSCCIICSHSDKRCL